MLGPDRQQWSITAFFVWFVLGWVMTPWLGLLAFAYVLVFAFCVGAGLVAVWTIEAWLQSVRRGRVARRGGVR